MTTRTGTSLTLTRLINADPETVFRAWTEPEQLKQWSAPEGLEVALAETDPRVGGRYHIRMVNAEGVAHNAVGVYQEVEFPTRLVYTWSWQEKEHDVGETRVTVEFKKSGDGTEVVLTHELLLNEEARVAHEQGWTSCLNRLEALHT
jgi:uncharacterized protein YndB with AHSA1/START domain